jgi:FlaA1/EpsC-like NDP-sugar epimerase
VTTVGHVHWRRSVQAILDVAAWLAGFALAMLLRSEFRPSEVTWTIVVAVGAFAGFFHVAIGSFVRLYRGRFAYGSFDEVLGVARTVLLVTVGVELVVLLPAPDLLPASRPIMSGCLALILMLALRYTVRLVAEAQRRPSDTAEPVIVLGAGDAGRQLIRSIQQNRNSPYRVAAVLDDDPELHQLQVCGIRVGGGRDHLASAAHETGSRIIVVALPQATAALLRSVHDQATGLGLRVKVLPSLSDLPDGAVTVFDVRDINEEDLLGRSAVHTDLTEIGQFLHGKRVLITGAGGSIGSELARQVHAFEPAALGLLDRDENGLHRTQLSIEHRALLDDDNTILASIRDPQRMVEVFEAFKPDIVFHAAALKHLPLLEKYPAEATKTNVFGTLNVLRAAQAAGVTVFVNISTDKAANPINVLGYSKRITERLTAAVGEECEGTYVSVRFGNVLGSQGSVLHSFAAQIADGGPVTVTHPDVTRFFMTIPEAVLLLLQAAAIGEDGEVLVLDMGESVRIADVAEYLIRLSGREIGLLFTGLRPGEKLDEDLFGAGETDLRPNHPLVSQTRVPCLAPAILELLDVCAPEQDLRSRLRIVASQSTSERQRDSGRRVTSDQGASPGPTAGRGRQLSPGTTPRTPRRTRRAGVQAEPAPRQ